MQFLTEVALEKSPHGLFTRTDVACWASGSQDRQFNLIKRALASGEVLHLRRGLYHLAPRYLRGKADPFTLAQRLYGPSYLSLETALAYHGWIPEAVYAITSASVDRAREFETPLGHFSFVPVPQRIFYTQVDRIEKSPGQIFLIATPLKALADYVYVHKQDWRSVRPVIESLRVDESALGSVTLAAIAELLENYASRRVQQFLKGLQKDFIHERQTHSRPA